IVKYHVTPVGAPLLGVRVPRPPPPLAPPPPPAAPLSAPPAPWAPGGAPRGRRAGGPRPRRARPPSPGGRTRRRARRWPRAHALWDAGIRRYGFHGLSYEYVVHELGAASRGRLVIAHLGSGASMAAVRDGRAVETTMGLTPTGGLMMGTRPGDLDPGVLLHLLATRQYDVGALTTLIERRSGLLGVSGLSADVRTLLAARERNPDAALAIAMFCHRARREVGAMAAVLGGMDSLVFTGGIGEHSAVIRQEICQGLEHLGVVLDTDANTAHAPIVSRRGVACVVRVVRTNEDLMVARHTRAVLQG